MCIVFLAVGLFCIISWFEQPKISAPHSATKNLKKGKISTVKSPVKHKAVSLVKANASPASSVTKVPRAVLATEKIAHGKSLHDTCNVKVAAVKKIKFFPAEVEVGLEKSFYSVMSVDSSIWKKKFGWPSKREVKWLANSTWGELAGNLCDYFKIRDCFKIIMAIFVHESSASPWAVNTSSGAVGGGQVVHKTARLLAAAKECQFPVEYLNRAYPEQNIFLIIVLFKINLGIAKSRGYDNYRDWAILYHYAGPAVAEDTAAAHGGLYNVPFVQSILTIESIDSREAPAWAQSLWAKEDWATIENIRRIAGGQKPQKITPRKIDVATANADAD
jgi:hypothetical protein